MDGTDGGYADVSIYGAMNRLCVILGAAAFLLSIAVILTGGSHIQLVAMLAGFAVRDAMANLKDEE